MKLFSLSPATTNYTEATEHFRNGDSTAALRSLMAGFRADGDYLPLYELAADVLESLGGAEEAQLFSEAAADFDSFDPFFNLGYHFVDVGNYDLARPFLEKAVRLNPEDAGAAFELSLTMPLETGRAIEVLERVEHLSDFWVIYRLHFLRLLNNRPEGVAEFIEDAREQVAEFPPEDEAETGIIGEKLLELEECLIRYDQLARAEQHIRDWQFIQYGGALLDYFEDADEYVAGGRYVAAFGGNESVRAVLEKLLRFLSALERLPERVYGVNDRNSEIVGRTIALLLRQEFLTLDEDADTTNALVVAADNSSFNGYTDLYTVRSGQTVFAFNLDWLDQAMITPDVAGVMSQYYTFPWSSEGLQVIDGGTARMAPDERAPIEIAEELAALSPEFLEGFDQILSFYSSVRDYLKGGRNGGSNRWSFVRDSPVPGAYFL